MAEADGVGSGPSAPRSRTTGLQRRVIVRSALIFAWAFFLYIFNFGVLWYIGLCFMLAFHFYREFVLYEKQRNAIAQRQFLYAEDFLKIMGDYPSWVNFSEDERTTFINTALQQLWPNAKKATEDTVQNSCTAIFAQIKPSFLSTFGFETFDLGNDPPEITTVNVVQWHKDAVAIDLGIRMANGENDVVLSIGAGKVNVSVKVQNLEVQGTIRVLLAPLIDNVTPFEALSVSIIDKLDLHYKLAAVALPLSAIPGLEKFLNKFINDILTTSLVWPRKVVVPMLTLDPYPDSLSWLFTSVCSDGLLHVTVVRAQGLSKMDVSSSDPYVKLSIRGDDVVKTKVQKKTTDPHWDESFELSVYDVATQSLHVQIYDYDKLDHDDPMGFCDIPISRLTPNKQIFITKTLTGGEGTISLLVTYKPFVTIPPPIDRVWERSDHHALGQTPAFLFVDVRRIEKIEKPKAVEFAVLHRTTAHGADGTRSREYVKMGESWAVVPWERMCIFEQGYAFPLRNADDGHVRIEFNNKLGSVDLDGLKLAYDAGYYGTLKEFKLADGEILYVHLTVRVIDSETEMASDDHVGPMPTIQRHTTGMWGMRNRKKTGGHRDSASQMEAMATQPELPSSPRPPSQSNLEPEELVKASVAELTKQTTQEAENAAVDVVASYHRIIADLKKNLPSAIVDAGVIIVTLLAFMLLTYLPLPWSVELLLFLLTCGFIYFNSSTKAQAKAQRMAALQSDGVDLSRCSTVELGRLAELAPAWAVVPDYEKTEWLNEVISIIWPRVNQAVGAMVQETLRDMKNKRQSPFDILEDLTVNLSLGHHGPLINGIHVYNSDLTSESVMLDIDLSLAGDIFVEVEATYKKFKVPVELSDLVLDTTLRVILKNFVDVYPCFNTVDISLTRPLNLDFQLSVLDVPIMSLPLLSNALSFGLNSIILRQLEGAQLIWPHVMSVDLADVQPAAPKGVGILRVWVKQAKHLRNVDWSLLGKNKSDPYVTLTLYEDEAIKLRTRVIDDDLNPVWNEYFEFVMLSNSRPFRMMVKDDDRVGKNVELGRAELMTNDLQFAPDTRISRTFDFTHKGKSAGHLDAIFEYKPFTSTIDSEYFDHDFEDKALGVVFVDIIRGRNMPPAGSAVRASIGNSSQGMDFVQGRSPAYKKRFTFLIRSFMSEKLSLEILTHNKLRHESSLGKIVVDLSDVAKSSGVLLTQKLKRGQTIQFRVALRTVKPDTDKPEVISWESYMKKREKEQEAELKRIDAEAKEAAETLDTAGPEAVTQAVATDINRAYIVDRPPERPGHAIVVVQKAINLHGVNANGFSDPYVSISCEGKKHRTKHISRTINPVWEERLTIAVADPETAVLEIQVKDHEGFMRANKHLGRAEIPIKSIKLQEEPRVVDLEDGRGQLFLALLYSEASQEELDKRKKSKKRQSTLQLQPPESPEHTLPEQESMI